MNSDLSACIWFWIVIGGIMLLATIYKLSLILILGPPGYY